MNPGNVVTLTGKITSTPTFVCGSKGKEFSMYATISVKKNFKNSEGVYGYDHIPFRIIGEKRMKFAHMLNKGDMISLTGCISSYRSSKELKYDDGVCVLAENIQYTPQFRKKENNDDIEDESLPFKIS